MTETSAIYEGFLFDMDGTLVDSTAVVEGVWGEVARAHGLEAQDLYDFGHGRQSFVTVDHFLGHLSAEERAEIVRWIGVEEESRLDGVVEIPGARRLMETLLEQSIPVALVTSAHDALARARMGAAGVPMPPITITAELVERSKPDPDGYLRGAERIGVPIERVLAFEDAPAGIAAVVSSGADLAVVGGGTSDRARFTLPDLAASRIEPTANGVRFRVG